MSKISVCLMRKKKKQKFWNAVTSNDKNVAPPKMGRLMGEGEKSEMEVPPP